MAPSKIIPKIRGATLGKCAAMVEKFIWVPTLEDIKQMAHGHVVEVVRRNADDISVCVRPKMEQDDQFKLPL